jgi:hypothetical protein
MGEPQQLSGGELNAAVTSEVVRIHTANTWDAGRQSPTRSRASAMGQGRSRS